MKIRIEETTYEGTAVEIMDQLRGQALDPTEYPDTESYIRQLQGNFIRMTDRDCPLPEGGTELRAGRLFARLAEIGALELLEDG